MEREKFYMEWMYLNRDNSQKGGRIGGIPWSTLTAHHCMNEIHCSCDGNADTDGFCIVCGKSRPQDAP